MLYLATLHSDSVGVELKRPSFGSLTGRRLNLDCSSHPVGKLHYDVIASPGRFLLHNITFRLMTKKRPAYHLAMVDKSVC